MEKTAIKSQQEVKTFEDLEFQTHPLRCAGYNIMAQYEFTNGYGLSIVNGPNAYCDDETYEVAILHNGEITYDTPLTDDVLTYQTIEDINKLIEVVKQYK